MNLLKLINLVFLLLLLSPNIELKAQKSKKAKSGEIKYKWHRGKAILKTDLPLVGKFKYNPVKNDIPHWIYIADKPNAEKKYIDIPLFRELTLEGAEPYITDRSDSTYYQWVDEYDNLMRRVKKGKIDLFDNSKVINEEYEFLRDYYLVGIKDGVGQRKLNQVKDLKVLMSDKPYFMESAELTGRTDSRDLRVVAFLVDLYNADKPIEFLNWEKAEITTKRGDKLLGYAHIQPVDLRNEYETSNKALVHFWKDGEFRIIESRSIKKLKLNGVLYREGYFGLTDKTFLGKHWSYGGRSFLVTNRILNNNSYFFTVREEEKSQALIILEKKAGSFVKPSDEMNLRQIFIKENNF